MLGALARLLADEQGASMVEYGILAAALVIPIVGFMVLVSTSAGNVMSSTGSALTLNAEMGN